MNWYLTVLRKYAQFSGRAHRREYWMFVLFNLIFTIVVAVADGAMGAEGLLYGAYGLAVLLPSFAVGARRLHDIGRSGWWLLIALVPFVGAIVLLVFMVSAGTPGDNRFGPPPEASASLTQQPLTPLLTQPVGTSPGPPPAFHVKKCPFCAESIKAEAVVCRYCGRDLPAAPAG